VAVQVGIGKERKKEEGKDDGGLECIAPIELCMTIQRLSCFPSSLFLYGPFEAVTVKNQPQYPT
jgi:hypothetical protein